MVAGVSEIVAGVMLALGLATPLAAAMAVSIMFVAAATVHLRNGFFITEGGFEYNLVFGAAALALGFTGPGTVAVDALIGVSTSGLAWGFLALAVGLVGGLLQLAQRRPVAS
jgi:putative oxidoreductase